MIRKRWTTQEIELLKKLWAEWVTVPEIAWQMKKTKDSIAHKVNRLELPPRLISTRPKDLPESLKIVQLKPKARFHQCRWPIGMPRTPDFHFCEDEAAEGKSYCEKHCKMAYVPARSARLW